jgi:hypothetical protein
LRQGQIDPAFFFEKSDYEIIERMRHIDTWHTCTSTHAFASGFLQMRLAVAPLPLAILRLRQAGYGLCLGPVSQSQASPISSRALPGTQLIENTLHNLTRDIMIPACSPHRLPCMALDISFLVCFSWLRISSSGKSLVAGEKIKLRSKMK